MTDTIDVNEPVPPPSVDVVTEQPSVVVDTITLDDIQNEKDVLFQREQTIRSSLVDALLNWSLSDLKSKLVKWALQGYTPNYPILDISFDTLPVCSDGNARSGLGFVEYLIGCSISDVIDKFASKVTGVVFTFRYTDTSITILVIKPMA